MTLFSKFHPLLVHFPIALVLAAAVAELVVIATAREAWRTVAVANIRAGAAMGVVTAITGWLFASSPFVDAGDVPRMASMAGHGRRGGRDRRGAPVVASTRVIAALGVRLPLHVVRHRTPRGDHRSSGWDARVGSQVLSTVVSVVGLIRRVSVKDKNDETEWDRRGFLKCMAWVGTGAVWTMTSGILKGMPIEQAARAGAGAGGLRFVQISDSHIGFNKDANPDVTATLRAAIAKIHALPQAPSFVLHTGDLTHLSKPEEFDTLQQELSAIGAPVFYVPGEHDVLNDNGKSYLERFGKNTQGRRLVQLRPGRRALHRAGQRRRSQGGRHGRARRRAARMAGGGREAAEEQHADCGVRAHPVVVGLSGVGLGHRRQRPRVVLSEAIRIGLGAERPHSSGDAEGRRERDVPHGDVDRVPAAGARRGTVAGTDEGRGAIG